MVNLAESRLASSSNNRSTEVMLFMVFAAAFEFSLVFDLYVIVSVVFCGLIPNCHCLTKC